MNRASIYRSIVPGVLGMLLAAGNASADSISPCSQTATDACYHSFQPAKGFGTLHYYASQSPAQPASSAEPETALIVMHGHPRDANKTFDAALAAIGSSRASRDIVVVAPVFQVAANQAHACSTAGVPTAQEGDLLWTCASWLDGGEARNAPGLTSFAAMDALVQEVHRQWPRIHNVTLAGFSAGAQMLQHYIGFAASPSSASLAMRYVIADPGIWLYFDDVRPQPIDEACVDNSCTFQFGKPGSGCPGVNRWKYGTEGLPAVPGHSAVEARQRYADADIAYIEGSLDSGTGENTYSRILDKSCATNAQGTYRLQRGLAYAAYDRQFIAPGKQRKVIVIPGCAHDVHCVFTSSAVRGLLLNEN
jgi:hypothetical protein